MFPPAAATAAAAAAPVLLQAGLTGAASLFSFTPAAVPVSVVMGAGVAIAGQNGGGAGTSEMEPGAAAAATPGDDVSLPGPSLELIGLRFDKRCSARRGLADRWG